MNTRSKFLSAALVASVLATGLAGGAAMASGPESSFFAVKSVNTLENKLTLADGFDYALPFGASAANYQVGERVLVLWTPSNQDARQAYGITAQ